MLITMLVLVLLLGIAWLTAWHCQNKLWNNGICRETSKRWHLAAYGTNGERCYRSDSYEIWISLPLIDGE